LPGASIVATAPGKVLRFQKKGPGGLEILVQHNGFVGINPLFEVGSVIMKSENYHSGYFLTS